MITMHHYLILSFALFMLGVIGVLLRRNILILLMSIELMLTGANLAFVTFSRYMGNDNSHAMVMFIIAIAAAEAAVGLALVIALFRHRKSALVDQYNFIHSEGSVTWHNRSPRC